jgi:inner membrane protein
MSGANHIVGGVVFTGIYLSMFDTNILSNPMFLAMTAFFAILADVDHTKTPIGKAFYPIAKYLDRKYGHRTITHSLLFYFTGSIIVGIVEMLLLGSAGVYTQIWFWSYGSHLVFDMLTKQGVPLFYPFKKNPCVIPANPDFRFRSSCIKTEAMLFVVFLGLGFSCKNLFAQGFWNTYNRTFDNIKHINAETRKTPNLIEVDYQVTIDGETITGMAEVLEANDNKLLLYDPKHGFTTITKNDFIQKLSPNRTKKRLLKSELNFSSISLDSLRQLVLHKKIIDLRLQSELPINYLKEKQPQTSTSISLQYVTNPVFKSRNIDSIDLGAAKELQELAIQQELQNTAYNDYLAQKQNAEHELHQLQLDLNSDDLSIREKAINNIAKAEAAVKVLQKPQRNSSSLLQLRRNFLLSKLHIKKNQSITGYMSYYETK